MLFNLQAQKRVRSKRLENVIQQVKKKQNLYDYFLDNSDESANGDENAASTPKKLCTDNGNNHLCLHFIFEVI